MFHRRFHKAGSIILLGVFLFAFFAPLSATLHISRAHAEATPLGVIATTKGYEGELLYALEPDSELAMYPHPSPPTLPAMFTDPPTLYDDDCAAGTPESDHSCEGGIVTYDLTEVTTSSFKITYKFTPTTHDPNAELEDPDMDMDDVYFWTYIKKSTEADESYVRISSGSSPYFHYEWTDGGDGVGQINVTTIESGKTYDVKIVGLYYYDENNVKDGHILATDFQVTTATAGSEEEAAAIEAAAEGGPTGTYASASFDDIWCVNMFESPFIDLAGCAAEFFQNVVFKVFSILAYIAGKFFDILANFSLQSDTYRDAGFVQEGWRVVRDFSNILFIVALVYLAFTLILDLGHAHLKKSIAAIIMMALLVNFSLFFSKILIDTSNILARIFYSQITVIGTPDDELTTSSLKEVNISRGIIAGFDPERIISPESKLKMNELLANGYKKSTIILLLYVIASIMMAVASWAFFINGLNFVQRTISLWLSMIFAPFAFVSRAFPVGLRGMKRLGWDAWLKDLLCWCFYAPLFFFFIYLIIMFANSNFLDTYISKAGDYHLFEFMIMLIFPFIILITLLIYAKNLAKSMGCEGADALVAGGKTLATGLAGFGIAAVAGGAAAIGRVTAGASAERKLEQDTLLKKAASGDKDSLNLITQQRSGYKRLSEVAAREKAKKEVERLQRRASSSYDARNTVGVKALAGAFGIDANKGAGILNKLTGDKVGFSTAETAGGRKAAKDRKTEKDLKFLESLGYDEETAKELEKKIKKRNDEIKGLRKEAEEEATTYREAKRNEAQHRQVSTDPNASADAKQKAVEALKIITDYESKDGKDKRRDRTAEMSRLRSDNADDKEALDKTKKGYLKEYAEYLERNRKKNIDRGRAAEDIAGSVRNLFSPTNLKRAFEQGLIGAGVGAGIAGPIGAGVGALTGAVKGLSDNFRGSTLTYLQTAFRRIGKGIDTKLDWDLTGVQAQADRAHEIKEGHFHPGHYKDTYKPVMEEFFKFFENLSKGGGGGGGGGGHKKSGGGGGHGGDHGHH